MRPSRPSSGKSDLFRERLDSIINLEHSLVQLGAVIPWDRFDHAFGGFFRPVGRAAKPPAVSREVVSEGFSGLQA